MHVRSTESRRAKKKKKKAQRPLKEEVKERERPPEPSRQAAVRSLCTWSLAGIQRAASDPDPNFVVRRR